MDFQVTKESAAKSLLEAISRLESGKIYDVSINERNIGKWSMSRLWRAWMGNIADWMIANGATMPLVIGSDGVASGKRPFNSDDAHELFAYMTLGCDENGNRLSWSKSGRNGVRPASKGERLLAMQRVEAWAVERGIKLMNPQDSEYRKLTEDS